jgi:transposase
MSKNHNLAESILEMNFGEFRCMLEYKARWYNRKIVFVNRFYPSSKKCHNCGHINKSLTLNDRKWVCPNCGQTIERDCNAALNILDEGLRILETTINVGRCTPELKLVDYPTAERRTARKCGAMDDPTGNSLLKSSGRLKQEVNNEQVSTLFKF